MNKKILISAILTAAPTAQLTATEIATVRTEALTPVLAKAKAVYTYDKKVLGANRWEDNSFDLRLSLVPANTENFSFWDVEGQTDAEAPQLDYELLVEFVNRYDGKVVTENLNFFLKAVGEGKFALKGTHTTTVVKEITEQDKAFEVIACNTTQNCDINGSEKGLVFIEDDSLVIVNPTAIFGLTFADSQLSGPLEKTLVFKKSDVK